MTMQTFVIMLFGFIFGWKKACLIISAYLLEGAVGLADLEDVFIKLTSNL